MITLRYPMQCGTAVYTEMFTPIPYRTGTIWTATMGIEAVAATAPVQGGLLLAYPQTTVADSSAAIVTFPQTGAASPIIKLIDWQTIDHLNPVGFHGPKRYSPKEGSSPPKLYSYVRNDTGATVRMFICVQLEED